MSLPLASRALFLFRCKEKEHHNYKNNLYQRQASLVEAAQFLEASTVALQTELHLEMYFRDASTNTSIFRG